LLRTRWFLSGWPRVYQLLKGSALEQIELQQPDDLLETQGRLAQELDVGQHQIDTHRDPYLGHDSVFTGAHEGLDLEVLLDPFEEQLDLPAGLVDLSDRGGGQSEVVGQEHEVLSGFRVAVTNSAKRDRAASRLAAVHVDGLVAGQPLFLVD